MEVIIGVIVIFIIWNILTAKSKREDFIRSEITKIYLSKAGTERGKLQFKRYQEFAENNGGTVDNKDAECNLQILSEKVKVDFSTSPFDNHVYISVQAKDPNSTQNDYFKDLYKDISKS